MLLDAFDQRRHGTCLERRHYCFVRDRKIILPGARLYIVLTGFHVAWIQNNIVAQLVERLRDLRLERDVNVLFGTPHRGVVKKFEFFKLQHLLFVDACVSLAAAVKWLAYLYVFLE